MNTLTDKELYELVWQSYSETNHDYIKEQANAACDHCANNPKNGGSGICHCILSNLVVY